jgi:hypothetical protein
MSASVFGAGIYGTSNETATSINIYTATVTLNVTNNVIWGANHIGDETSLAIGNKGADLSFSGLLSVTDDLGVAVADALQAADIANSGIFANATGVTVFYVINGSITRNNAGFQEGSLNTVGRDGLTDTTATTVT